MDHILIKGGRVYDHGRVTTIDEAALRESLAAVMPQLWKDRARVMKEAEKIYPYIPEADRRVWAEDVGAHRYIGPSPN